MRKPCAERILWPRGAMLLLLFDLRSVYPSSTRRHHRYLYKMPQHIFHIASVLTAHSKAPANHPRFQVFKTCARLITCCGNQKGNPYGFLHTQQENTFLLFSYYSFRCFTNICVLTFKLPHFVSLAPASLMRVAGKFTETKSIAF